MNWKSMLNKLSLSSIFRCGRTKRMSAAENVSASLLFHFEKYLGESVGGWKDPGEEKWPFYVMEYSGGPINDVTTLSTLGLSDFPLTFCSGCGKIIRHELMFMLRSSFGVRSMPALLHDIGKEAIDSESPYLCGEVLGPRGKVFPDTEMEALLFYMPTILPDEFGTIELLDGEKRIIAWVIPITKLEALFANDNGWESLIDLLIENETDLLDFYRKSAV